MKDRSTRKIVSKAKEELISTFTEGIAHELGTPLSIIQGRVEMLSGNLEAGPDKQNMEIIKSQVKRITVLVQNLLKFSKQAKTSSDLKCPIDEILTICDNHEEVEFKINGKIHQSHVRISRYHLGIIFQECFENAVEATPEDRDIKIVVELTAQPDHLLIEISDRGQGMSEKVLRRVFDPFFTTGLRGMETGLGMTLVKSLVEGYSGYISLESEMGRGTTVTLGIPFPTNGES